MKNAGALLLAMVLLLTIYSCKKNDGSGSGNNNVPGGSWSATINGQQKSGYASIIYETGTISSPSTTLIIGMVPVAGAIGANAYPAMSITIVDSTTITTGIYSLSALLSIGEYSSDSTHGYFCGGQVNVKQLNTGAKIISGTFNMIGYLGNDSAVITNGTFSDSIMSVIQ